jgi:GNAT superfamily N-acetyltransferase
VQVRAVSGRGDLRRFIDLPFRLHANRPQWVPPLKFERRLFLNRRMNAFFKHGEAEYFLAWRTDGGDSRVVGRITAHIDHAYNSYHGAVWGWFGFLEMEDDGEVARALLDAAASWLAERGCERMVGPAEFTVNDGAGILIEGFDAPALILEPWQPPYYQQLLEQAGVAKAVDMFVWEIDVSDRNNTLPVLFELAEKAESEHGIRLRRMSRLHLRRDLDAFAEVYNAAWSDHWGFVPYSKQDLDAYAQELQLAFDKNWFMVAEHEGTGEVVGLAITVPDLNQVARKMNGRILPVGWWYFLRKARIMTWIRVGFLGVKPEYQHTGVAALLYVEHFNTAERTPQKHGLCGWILESNTPMNRAMEAMGSRIAKRYRMYERTLGTAPPDGAPAAAEAALAAHGAPGAGSE